MTIKSRMIPPNHFHASKYDWRAVGKGEQARRTPLQSETWQKMMQQQKDRAFSKQAASPAGSENAENQGQVEHDPIQLDRIMLEQNSCASFSAACSIPSGGQAREEGTVPAPFTSATDSRPTPERLPMRS
ncbi:hypothetical protein [Sphingobium sp. Sx8-8]|uniref:hypothetical protein n=1 Tax=Sphingobium sp. Sx8-8 TaxID=2933617 RepID=UPI001F59BF0D|nr:hypothetical protein [Sphingobium sp. Sx8-8]